MVSESKFMVSDPSIYHNLDSNNRWISFLLYMQAWVFEEFGQMLNLICWEMLTFSHFVRHQKTHTPLDKFTPVADWKKQQIPTIGSLPIFDPRNLSYIKLLTYIYLHRSLIFHDNIFSSIQLPSKKTSAKTAEVDQTITMSCPAAVDVAFCAFTVQAHLETKRWYPFFFGCNLVPSLKLT